MFFKLNHICSNVHNMEKTVEFYTKILDGQVTNSCLLGADKLKCVYIQIADGLIELIEPAANDENATFGLVHIAFETDDLDGAYEYLTGLGYHFHVPPKVAASGNGRLAFFKDANGAVVELLQRDYTMYKEPTPSSFVLALDHYALNCADLKAAHTLYTDHLGMKNLAYFMVEKAGRELMYLESDKDILEIVHSADMPKDCNPHAHICLRVINTPETCDILEKRGIKFPENRIRKPGIEIGQTSSIVDPEGISIELVDRPDLRDFEKLGHTPKTLAPMREF